MGIAYGAVENQHRSAIAQAATGQKAVFPIHPRWGILTPRGSARPRRANRKEIAVKYLYQAAAVLALAFVAATAGAADIKIGYVDVERIRRESAPAERASKQLEKEFAPRAQELQRRESQVKALQSQLEKDGMTMSESERRSKEQELSRTSV